MIRPMMVITTRISTSVKPRSSFRIGRLAVVCLLSSQPSFIRSTCSANNLADGQQRCHHRYNQPTNHDTDNHDGYRACDPDQPIDAALLLRLIKFGDAAGQHRKLTGFLAQSEHTDSHYRQYRRLYQCIAKFSTLPHSLDGFGPG